MNQKSPFEDNQGISPQNLNFVQYGIGFIVFGILLWQIGSIKENIKDLKNERDGLQLSLAKNLEELERLKEEISYLPHILYKKAEQYGIDSSHTGRALSFLRTIQDSFPSSPYYQHAVDLEESLKEDDFESFNNYINSVDSNDTYELAQRYWLASKWNAYHPHVRRFAGNKLGQIESNFLTDLFTEENDFLFYQEKLQMIVDSNELSPRLTRSIENELHLLKRTIVDSSYINISPRKLVELAYGNRVNFNDLHNKKYFYVQGEIVDFVDSHLSNVVNALNELADVSIPSSGAFIVINGGEGNIICYVNDRELIRNLSKNQVINISGYYSSSINTISSKFSQIVYKTDNLNIPISLSPQDNDQDIILIDCKIDDYLFGLTKKDHLNKVKLIFHDIINLDRKEILSRIQSYYYLDSEKEASKVYSFLSCNSMLPWGEEEVKYGECISENFSFPGTWRSNSGNRFNVFSENGELFYSNIDLEWKYPLKNISANFFDVYSKKSSSTPTHKVRLVSQDLAIIYSSDQRESPIFNIWHKE